jgi:glycolate oxidase FAD binding subunit
MSLETVKPRDPAEVEAAIRWAYTEGKALELVGRGTKRAIGRAAQWDMTLDLSGFTGVTMYEPAELVLSAKAGTALADVEVLLAANDQELAFEPMDYGPLLGVPAAQGSLGGVIAANLSGPRRIKAGAARDHFLGVTAVSGRGETFKAGGRVVKNVTGYDLCKLLAGSWGTLAAMTEITMKVLPKAESEETLVIVGLDDARAVQAMAAAMGSACDVSGAAHAPVGIAPISARAATALRLEGVAPSVRHRKAMLEALLKSYGPLEILDEVQSRALWRAIRDVTAFAAAGPAGGRYLWRISTVPTGAAQVGRLLAAQAGAELMYDWAGGLIWAALPPSDGAASAIVRAAVAAAGGHATLIRAPAAVRAAVEVFEPEPAPLAALTKRVMESFDPRGILNVGRMWAGV